MNAQRDRPELPTWLWLWFPPAIVVASLVARAISEDAYQAVAISEYSVLEQGTVVLLLVAVVTGVRLVLARGRLPYKWIGAWCALLTVGCVYFAGEEASWGQHIFGWGTPEALAAVNAQEETNIHNIAGIFDQFPRLLLTAGVLIGGIVLPIVRRRRCGDWRPAAGKWGWLLPTVVCLPTSVLALAVGLPRTVSELEYPDGEFKEYFLGLFLMLYLLSLHRRMPAPAAD